MRQCSLPSLSAETAGIQSVSLNRVRVSEATGVKKSITSPFNGTNCKYMRSASTGVRSDLDCKVKVKTRLILHTDLVFEILFLFIYQINKLHFVILFLSYKVNYSGSRITRCRRGSKKNIELSDASS